MSFQFDTTMIPWSNMSFCACLGVKPSFIRSEVIPVLFFSYRKYTKEYKIIDRKQIKFFSYKLQLNGENMKVYYYDFRRTKKSHKTDDSEEKKYFKKKRECVSRSPHFESVKFTLRIRKFFSDPCSKLVVWTVDPYHFDTDREPRGHNDTDREPRGHTDPSDPDPHH